MDQKRLLLIAPYALTDTGPALHSLASLATYVEDACKVRVLLPGEDLANVVKVFKPDIVGVTSYTHTYPEAIRMMELVEQIDPRIIRIIGGVHITSAPWSLDPVFHAGVLGDGENVLSQIIKASSMRDLDDIGGICLPDGTMNPSENILASSIPVPKLDIHAPGSYSKGIVGMFTSKGCPYDCSFCYSKNMRREHVDHPVEFVGDQIQYAVDKLEAHSIMFWDDCIFDPRRVWDISEELESREITDLKFYVNVASLSMNRELAEAFKGLGTVSWNTGFESGSDRMLAKVKGRGANVERNKTLVELAHEFDMSLNGSFILGMPDETLHDMDMTMKFMEYLIDEKRNGRHKGGFWWFTATPFPGTSWWDIAEKRGTVSRDVNWSRLHFGNREEHLLLDGSISENDWEKVCEKADGHVSTSNSII